MKMMTIDHLYLSLLQDLHSCECQTIRVLPRMAGAASDTRLQKIFNKHLEEAKEHLERLNYILSCLPQSGEAGKVCEVTESLIKECEQLIEADAEADVRDAGLICVAQRFEHYEIAMYGCLRTYAALINRATDVRLLDLSLKEEKEADNALSEYAMGMGTESNITQPMTLLRTRVRSQTPVPTEYADAATA